MRPVLSAFSGNKRCKLKYRLDFLKINQIDYSIKPFPLSMWTTEVVRCDHLKETCYTLISFEWYRLFSSRITKCLLVFH